MRILVTGAGGLLGGRLAEQLSHEGHDVVAAVRESPPPPGLSSVTVDLAEPGAGPALLEEHRPDAVVHAAALGGARCESEPALAETLNARVPGRLAQACHERGIRLVGLSTDMVLGGDEAHSTERSEAAPLGAYGRTKLAGEAALLDANPDAAVARVALVIGLGHGLRGTGSETVAWALASGRSVRLFADEYRSPVDADSVARAVALLAEGDASGIFNVGGPERLTRLELGHRVARVLGLPAEGIEAGFQVEYSGPPRPADTSLDSRHARRALGWTARSLEESIRRGRLAPPGGSAVRP